MRRFKAREIVLLVSTTVIEVGIDVPKCDVMLIEHRRALRLSQLHHSCAGGGAVGRGKSYCILLTVAGSAKTRGAAWVR
jgi:ATP-dependent DNA helicase RecG